MKTRTINLNIKIPQWVPSKREWAMLWNTVKFKVAPDHCHVCGTRVDFRGAEFAGTVGPHRQQIMVSQNVKEPICGPCTADKVRTYYKRANLEERKCDCCGQVKPVVDSIPNMYSFSESDSDTTRNKSVADVLDLNMRYGMQWWNGFSLCVDCVTEVLKCENSRSSVLVAVQNKQYYLNHRGAMIKRKETK